MASYQVRQRDPLLDQNTQAILERRGKELLGGGLVALGVIAAMMLASYSPEDPSWMAASDAPAQNWLGRIGAGIASPLMVIVGYGAWLLPLGLLAWGVRFITHRGEERASAHIMKSLVKAIKNVEALIILNKDPWNHQYFYAENLSTYIQAGAPLMDVSPEYALEYIPRPFSYDLRPGQAFVMVTSRDQLPH